MYRGGIGASLGAIGSQLPYPYVHILYWTVQILLTALAIETGVSLADNWYFRQNGDNGYSPPDDTVSWPRNPNIWYLNVFLQTAAGNTIYALFTEGILSVCDKLSNPMSSDVFAFSEKLFDTFFYNNCQAMYMGTCNYQRVKQPIVKLDKAILKDEQEETKQA